MTNQTLLQPIEPEWTGTGMTTTDGLQLSYTKDGGVHIGMEAGANPVFSPFALPTTNKAPVPVSSDNSAADYNKQVEEFLAKQQDIMERQQKASAIAGAAGIVQQGMQASQGVGVPMDTQGAVIQAGTSALQGAVSGAMSGAMIAGTLTGGLGAPAGAAIGAVVGGLSGLILGGVNAWQNLSAGRAARREQERQQRYIKKLNAQARADTMEQVAYNRRQAALQSRADAFKTMQDLVNNRLRTDADLKKMFIKYAR